VQPKLLGLLGNDDEAARKYAAWTGRACEKDGIAFELREVEAHRYYYNVDRERARVCVCVCVVERDWMALNVKCLVSS
jgi:5,10-methylene-tetrahydrofolate dehydrogenase/methenyl tetrahydrofolate cyclohydrolase